MVTSVLVVPVQLNIVCFRYRALNSDRINADIVADLHESGIAAPSTTILEGRVAIRAAIVNHRTQPCDIDALIDATLRFGQANSIRVLPRGEATIEYGKNSMPSWPAFPSAHPVSVPVTT